MANFHGNKSGAKKSPLSYQERTYRRVEDSGLVSSIVKIGETDLHILASEPVTDPALLLIARVRQSIEQYIQQNPLFLDSLIPLPMDKTAPEVVQQMLAAGMKAGVGPMAAVAGVIAEQVGRGLLRLGIAEVIVENGGDLFIARQQQCTVGIFAGESPLSGKVGIRLLAEQQPCGVCCSSGTIGHSLSLGMADAVLVSAPSTALADAAATRLANGVTDKKESINLTLELAKTIDGLSGVVIIVEEQIGAWGAIELVQL
jgi:ApbE superfamily uncharacterized protein (UPF0280 family)